LFIVMAAHIEATARIAQEAEEAEKFAQSTQKALESTVKGVDDLVSLPPIPQEMMHASEKYGVHEDPQTLKFMTLITAATNFSSLNLALLPELVGTIRQLLGDIKQEINAHTTVTNKVEELMRCFSRFVAENKLKAKNLTSHLEDTSPHLEVIADCLKAEATEAGTQDALIAVTEICTGVLNIKDYFLEAKNGSTEIQSKIEGLRLIVQEKKLILNGCLELSKIFEPALLGPIANIVGGPQQELELLAHLSLFASCAIQSMDHYLKYLQTLESANTLFFEYVGALEASAISMGLNTYKMLLGLTNETRRKKNINICETAAEASNAMVKYLQMITKMDVSWITRAMDN